MIKNDFEGLCNYLEASNIKHKTKHPIFFALKFPKCVKFYYNSRAFIYKDELSKQRIILSLQNVLNSIPHRRSNKIKEASQLTSSTTLFRFIIIIPDNLNCFPYAKTITEHFGVLNHPFLAFSWNTSELSYDFLQFSEVDLLKSYQETYPKLGKKSVGSRFSQLDQKTVVWPCEEEKALLSSPNNANHPNFESNQDRMMNNALSTSQQTNSQQQCLLMSFSNTDLLHHIEYWLRQKQMRADLCSWPNLSQPAFLRGIPNYRPIASRIALPILPYNMFPVTKKPVIN